MANAIENALSRASAEQQSKNQQVIEEARRNIKLVSVREDVAPSNAETIKEARQNIPIETMKEVDEISPPMNTPSMKSPANSKIVELHPNAQSTIESIEQGQGNNYLRENAMDRAMARPSQEPEREQQQQSLGR